MSDSQTTLTIHITLCDEVVELKDIDPNNYSISQLIRDAKERIYNYPTILPAEEYDLQGLQPWDLEMTAIVTDTDLYDIMLGCIRQKVPKLFIFGELLPIATSIPDDNLSDIEQFNMTNDENEDSDGEPTVIDISGSSSDDDSDVDLCGYTSSDRDGLDVEYSDDDCPPVKKMSKDLHEKEFKKTFVHGQEKIVWAVGQTFRDLNHFKDTMQDYLVQEGLKIKKLKNDASRQTIKCLSENCPWRIHCSKLTGCNTFQVKTLNDEHLCGKVTNNSQASVKWLVKECGELFRSTVGCGLEPVEKYLFNKHKLIVTQAKLWRAKNKAIIEGGLGHEEQFRKVYSYAKIVDATNPGSLVVVRSEDTVIPRHPIFRRVMVSFAAQKEGFVKGCRYFLGIDGCHLKGPYGGVLLSAVGIDANNNLFPVAVGWVEAENYNSWHWFLYNLQYHLGIVDDSSVTFMSDRQKGILKALGEIWGESEMRFCARHIYANFRQKWPCLKLRRLFWAASQATNKVDYLKIMSDLSKVDAQAYQWLLDSDPDHWSKHNFRLQVKSDHTTNNMSESFNSWLKKERSMPMLTMLESYRRRIMKRMYKRHQDALKWDTQFPPQVNKKIKKLIEEGRKLRVWSPGSSLHEVLDEYQTPMRTYLVDIDKQTCDCGAWQLIGIPCSHGMAALGFQGMITDKIEDYVAKHYTTAMYIQTYQYVINPIPDQRTWPEADKEPQAPDKKIKKGRPNLGDRRREVGEKKKRAKNYTVVCGLCHVIGHNRRSCPMRTNQRTQTATSGMEQGSSSNIATQSSQHSTVTGREQHEPNNHAIPTDGPLD